MLAAKQDSTETAPPVIGRVSVQPINVTKALPEDQRVAVDVLEVHLWQRGQRRKNPAFEVLPDGTAGVFLTTGHVRKILHQIRARKKGEKFAAQIINTILPGLGLIEDTGLTKKPRTRPHPHQNESHSQNGTDVTEEGGRHSQPATLHSYWYRVFRLPTLTKMLTPICGAYGTTCLTRPKVTASLSALLKSQGLISKRKRRNGFSHGSVQEAFWATGPP
jgi:hypothetical protein